MLLVAFVVTALAAAPARADRVPELARTLTRSKNEKERIAAAVSLGRLKDRRSLKVLASALGDRSRTVRAVAATALGHLGDPAALPALRNAAEDPDPAVRRRIATAIDRIEDTRGAYTPAPSSRAARDANLARYAIAGREPPRLSPSKPGLYLVIKSASDESAGQASKHMRKRRASQMRSMLGEELAHSATVTIDSARATELGLARYGIDISILKLERAVRGQWVEIECEIRIAVSDQRGKMLSLLTGGAKVQVPRGSFRSEQESYHQGEALENAVKSVYQDMLKYLAQRPT